MADSIHNTLASFRDTMLQSIAQLEFQMRDIAMMIRPSPYLEPTPSYYETPMPTHTVSNELIQTLIERIESLESKLTDSVKQEPVSSFDEIKEILTIEKPYTTRNILIPSVRSTPALAAAVAAADETGPHPIILDSESDSESESDVAIVQHERCEMSESDCTGQVEEDEDDNGSGESESDPELKKVVIQGVSYYMDESNTVYQETEDGYEEVGVYNPKFDRIDVTEAEEEEEEEEEAIETEEFVYKGQTYQRDAEGNVYDDEGDVIGHWNGKKIVAVPA
jgi:hypothetical protein